MTGSVGGGGREWGVRVGGDYGVIFGGGILI